MDRQKAHSYTCAYSRCANRSRDNVPGLRFYGLPTTAEPALAVQWLVNSGLAHIAEATEKELSRIRICSQHFSRGHIRPNGRLVRNAVPFAYDRKPIVTEIAPVPAIHHTCAIEKKALLREIKVRDDEIVRLNQSNAELRRSLKNVKLSLSRQTNKIRAGILSDESLAKAVARRVGGFLYTFIIMQLFHKQHADYSQDEKEMAMKMYYTSPSLYTKLRENFGFILPSMATLKRWFGNINLWPGICPAIFDCLKAKVSCMDRNERQGILLFDEVKLKKGLEYNESRQKIEGFQDLGTLGSSTGVATSALAFMARGLLNNWKQPIGYFLTAGPVNSETLSQLIDLMLDGVIDSGLEVRGLVCDQGPNNQSVISKRLSPDGPYFIYKEQKIYCFFDAPHLWKSLRNQLLMYDIIFDLLRKASWNDVRRLWELEQNELTRAAVKLSSKHVNPGLFEKMNCRLALQVISRRVAAALTTAGTTNCIDSDTVMDTAWFFTELNDAFDNLNSRCPNDANPNRCALSDQRPQVQENLEGVLKRSAEWRTVTDKGPKVPPCFKGVRQTIQAVLMLWEDLKKEDVKFLMTSRLNQDPLENLFSMIRCHGGTYNQNPTATQFRLIFQKNIVLNLMKPAQSANCLDDEDDTLLHADVQAAANNRTRKVAEPSTEASYSGAQHHFDEEPDNDSDADEDLIDIEDILAKVDQSRTTEATLAKSAVEYLAGYIAKKSVDKTRCERCRETLINPEPKLGDRHLLTYFRAYETKDEKEFGHMCVATDGFSFVFDLINAIFDAAYPLLRAQYGIQDKIFRLMKSAVNRTPEHTDWFDDDICGQHRCELAYNFMRVKINKDVKWMGELLRAQTTRSSHSKAPRKMMNLRSA